MTDRYKASGAQARFEPGSNDEVLENLLGITSKPQMDQEELRCLTLAQLYYAEQVLTKESRLTADLICQMHFSWLGSLYSWAGSYRTVNVAKGEFRWPPYGFILGNIGAFEKGLLKKYTPCASTDINILCRQLAEVHAEFLLIHPFRDGNGRMARWIADIMAIQAGFPVPDYEFSGPNLSSKKAAYIEAVVLGYQMEYDALTAFFRSAIEKALSESLSSGNSTGTIPTAPSTNEDS